MALYYYFYMAAAFEISIIWLIQSILDTQIILWKFYHGKEFLDKVPWYADSKF